MGATRKEGDWAYEWAKRLAGERAESQRVGLSFETPAHEVRIAKGFWMYRHEVTNAQYRRFSPAHDSGTLGGLSLNGDLQPVVTVTWEECTAYCRWAGGTLPTEAQWEYACRAGTTTPFWWGASETEAGKYANVLDRAYQAKWHAGEVFDPEGEIFDTDDGQVVSAPVGGCAPNRFGLYDMIGNAWEWCGDWFGPGYDPEAPVSDPEGPATGTLRVLRGGSWNNQPYWTRSAARANCRPEGSHASFGFRCVVSPE